MKCKWCKDTRKIVGFTEVYDCDQCPQSQPIHVTPIPSPPAPPALLAGAGLLSQDEVDAILDELFDDIGQSCNDVAR